MLVRVPPDPPEKWHAVESALEDPAKTRRLCLILLVSMIPLALILAAIIVLALTKH